MFCYPWNPSCDLAPLLASLSPFPLAQNPKVLKRVWTLYEKSNCFRLKHQVWFANGTWLSTALLGGSNPWDVGYRERGVRPSTSCLRVCVPLWDLGLVCVVHFHSHQTPELELGRQSFMSEDFLALDESSTPCCTSRNLTTRNLDERQMKGWPSSSLIVSFGWRWPRRGRDDAKPRKTIILFWH